MKSLKKLSALMSLVLGMVFLGGSVWAHDDDKSKDQALTGEVVCLSCYLGHGGMGEVHAKCAKQCFKNGLPIGLKVGDKLYLAVGEHHGTANQMLSSYAGKQVTVSGHVVEEEGMSMIEVESVAKSGASKQAGLNKKSTAVVYTCSMHPEVTSDKPGKCPKCGMELVEKK